MWLLTARAMTFNAKEVEIAYFSSKELAHEYIDKSKLKRPKEVGDRFKQRSLLAGFHEAFVEYEERQDLPVDPDPPK